MGHATLKFLKDNFGEVEIIESLQSFFRYKIIENVKLSKLFGDIEKEKERLNLSQYSIRQTSIEQIFIGFAEKREVLDE